MIYEYDLTDDTNFGDTLAKQVQDFDDVSEEWVTQAAIKFGAKMMLYHTADTLRVSNMNLVKEGASKKSFFALLNEKIQDEYNRLCQEAKEL